MGMGSLGGREVRGAPKYELMEVVQNPKSGGQFSRPVLHLLCRVPAGELSPGGSQPKPPYPSPIQLARKGQGRRGSERMPRTGAGVFLHRGRPVWRFKGRAGQGRD